jgi:hypothetical protein
MDIIVIIMASLCLVATAFTTPVIANGDEWEESGRDAKLIDATGTYTGTINSPGGSSGDTDASLLDVSDGDYISEADAPREQVAFSVVISDRDGSVRRKKTHIQTTSMPEWQFMMVGIRRGGQFIPSKTVTSVSGCTIIPIKQTHRTIGK